MQTLMSRSDNMRSWELGDVWETKLENSRTDARGSISYLNQNPPPLPPKELFFNFFLKNYVYNLFFLFLMHRASHQTAWFWGI